MTRWPIVRLGDLVTFYGGGTPRRDRKDYWGGEIPWASVKDLQTQELHSTVETITVAGLENSATNLVPAGTVIVASRVGLGKVVINSVPVAINQDLKAIAPIDDRLNPQYLKFFLVSRASYLAKAGVGATVKGLTVGDFQKLEMWLPPMSEQERIATLLDEADALRKLRAQADQRIAQLIPALFNDKFGDPATNAMGWPVKQAGELMTDCDYGTSQRSDEAPNGVPILRMGNVTSTGGLDMRDLKKVSIDENDYVKYRLQLGDVLFNRTNSRELVGKTGLWDGRFDAVAASYFIRVRLDPTLEHPQHFTTFMNLPFMKQKLARMARGAIGQANINAKELKSITVPTPPIVLQQEFAHHVIKAQELESHQKAHHHRLDAAFQVMLQRAFAGELG